MRDTRWGGKNPLTSHFSTLPAHREHLSGGRRRLDNDRVCCGHLSRPRVPIDYERRRDAPNPPPPVRLTVNGGGNARLIRFYPPSTLLVTASFINNNNDNNISIFFFRFANNISSNNTCRTRPHSVTETIRLYIGDALYTHVFAGTLLPRPHACLCRYIALSLNPIAPYRDLTTRYVQ